MQAEFRKPSLKRALVLATVALTLCLPAEAEPKYQVLHSFNGTDGTGPCGGVIVDGKGNVYGATASGGNMQKCNGYGCGVVFELARQHSNHWTETMLYSFADGTDGAVSYGSLVLDASHNLYGTTEFGGTHNVGTAFEVTHGAGGWTDDVLYAFGEQSSDGGWPTAGLAMDKAGNLYGTTPKPGDVFELSPRTNGWMETVIYQFCLSNPACVDGVGPYAGVILDAAGNLYGTTSGGGTGTRCGGDGCGTVYELRPTQSGWEEKIVHDFTNDGKDGAVPGWGALFMDAKGNLYGTTASGGCCGGVVFKLTPQTDGRWKEAILYEFPGGVDGFEPNAGVVMDKAGNLYGTTDYGGDPYCGCGVIYKLSPGHNGKWTYTVLHEFGIGNDGGVPEGNLVMDSKGNLYGGTALGGTYGGGVVFELTP
jgi:uncharacterized repeat protein (TIGR03803 family)